MTNEKITDENFIEIIKKSYNIRQALITMGLKPKGSNYKTLSNRCERLSIPLPQNETLVIKPGTEKEIRNNTKDEEIILLSSQLFSRQSLLKALGLNQDSGSNVRWIKNKIVQLNINTNHWTGMAHLKGKTNIWSSKIDILDLMNSNTSNTGNLKRRLIKEGYLTNICSNCNIIEWCGQKLSLHLDHIDGDNTNNKLDNLRLLCPNCHSLTDTYCGKNKKTKMVA